MADSPMSSPLAPAAERQLAAWQELARDWATLRVLDVDCGIWVVRCASCFGGIYRATDRHGHEYRYSDAEIGALVVDHLRRSHPGLDPDRG